MGIKNDDGETVTLLEEYDELQIIPPYVYVVVRGIAVDADEEERVREDIAKRVGDDYVVMLTGNPEEVPHAAA